MPLNTEPELTFHNAPSEFVSLEEKIYRTIEMLKSAREAKGAAERDLGRIRQELEAREEEVETLKAEIVALKRDREETKSRVEKMLQQMDAIIAASE